MSETAMTEDRFKPTEEYRRRLRSRNIAVGLALAALCVLFYFATWARFAGGS